MSSAKAIADIFRFSEAMGLDIKAAGNPLTSQPIYIAACAFLQEPASRASRDPTLQQQSHGGGGGGGGGGGVAAAAVLVAVAVVTEDRPIHSLHLLRSRNSSTATRRSRTSSRTGGASSTY